MNKWNPPETAPIDGTEVLACGWPIEKVSGLRKGFEIANAYYRKVGWRARTVWHEGWGEFHLFGWAPILKHEKLEPPQPLPKGEPKYKPGDKVLVKTRYDGTKEATIVSVIGWPNGWFYELDNRYQVGKDIWYGNQSIEYGLNGEVRWMPCPEKALESWQIQEATIDG